MDSIEEEVDMDFVCGALLSPEDENDLILEEVSGFSDADVLLPEEYHCVLETPVRNQGKRGTCAAHTGATLLEYRTKIPMSVEYIYSKRINGSSEGMYARDLLEILKRHGSVSEENCPYGCTVVEPVSGEHIKISSYARVRSIEGLKYALVTTGPCYVALPYRSGGPQFWQIVTPRIRRTIGYHAVTCIGYNTTGFILRNSWGGAWNENGTTILPYEDFPIISECWIAYF